MTVNDLDDVDYDLEVDGQQVRRTVRRKVLARGGWATVAIVFEERTDDRTGWRPPRVAVIRMRKLRDVWHRHAAFVLDADEARELTAFVGDL